MDKRKEKAFESLGEKFNALTDKLARTQCPVCLSYTLEADLIVRSGTRFSCRGWKADGEEQSCDFRLVIAITSPEDLPDINEKAVKVEVE